MRALAVLGTHGLTAFYVLLCLAWAANRNWPKAVYFAAAAVLNAAVMLMK